MNQISLYNIEVKETQTDKCYYDSIITKFRIFDNGIFVGKCSVCFRENVFSSWENKDEEFYEESRKDFKSIYIIGISTMDRKGYGTMLIDHIENYAKENGCIYSSLSSVTSALGFWKKVGYTVYSTGEYYSMYKEL